MASLILARGVVTAGLLPRRAAVAFAVGTVGGIVFGETPWGIVAMAVGLAGMLGLARAMAREPLVGGRTWEGNVVVPSGA